MANDIFFSINNKSWVIGGSNNDQHENKGNHGNNTEYFTYRKVCLLNSLKNKKILTSGSTLRLESARFSI